MADIKVFAPDLVRALRERQGEQIGPDSRLVESQEDAVVVCARTEDGPSSVPGAMETPCMECEKSVWISPSSRDTIFARSTGLKKTFVWCIQCFVRHKKT
jgi:hypothetical protein